MLRVLALLSLLTGCNLVLELDGCPDGGCVKQLECAADDRCNGLDDDCDGAIDEGASVICYEGPGGTEGVAACRAGVARCVAEPGSGAETYGECEGQVLPEAEACNGVDDDCDGEVDLVEGEPVEQPCYPFDEGEPGVGICVAGRAVCANASFGLCEGAMGPRDETDDGTDEDCDGEVDE